MTKPIRGKVARIFNSRELVINVGSEHGVKVEMKFDVLNPKGEDIKEPDTGEILGSIKRPKVRVKVTSVQEKLAVASTYRKIEVNVGGVFGGLSANTIFAKSLMPPQWVAKYETLKTEEKTWEDLDEEGIYVINGDPVVQVLVDEEDM